MMPSLDEKSDPAGKLLSPRTARTEHRRVPDIARSCPASSGGVVSSAADLYHESLESLTPADVYFGRGPAILKRTETIKRKTIEEKRRLHQRGNRSLNPSNSMSQILSKIARPRSEKSPDQDPKCSRHTCFRLRRTCSRLTNVNVSSSLPLVAG
jgi:hypothetical protein